MYPFVESICIDKGDVKNLSYHNERMNRTRKDLFQAKDLLDLKEYIFPEDDILMYKCRVEYREQIEKVEYIIYQKKTINSLQVVLDNSIDYKYKSTDRSHLNKLYALRGKCDDILIIKQGLITDTSAGNVAFWDGKQWITPQKPLLEGTCRAHLLKSGEIIPKDIFLEDINDYQTIRIFNAMLPFGEIELPASQIHRD